VKSTMLYTIHTRWR